MTAKVDAILVANGIKPEENHLEQHGIKGMKWGVRKRRSTSVDKQKPKPSTTAKESRQVQRTSDRSRGAGKANSFAQRPQNRRMSDAELRNRLNRLQMEKQYRELTTSPKGKSFVKEVLQDTGKRILALLKLGFASSVDETEEALPLLLVHDARPDDFRPPAATGAAGRPCRPTCG